MVDSCVSDPGLFELRSVVDIPIGGRFESATHLAATMGAAWSAVTVEEVVAKRFDKLLVDLYGVRQSMASIRHIDIRASQLYPEITPTSEVARSVIEVGGRCVEEDGAEVIISGCAFIGGMLTQHHGHAAGSFLAGVPVLDGVVVGLKTAELMVDMVTLGYPAVSRLGYWKKPPHQETSGLREWLTNHDSPFRHNWERMPAK